jgi:hypothetical protein
MNVRISPTTLETCIGPCLSAVVQKEGVFRQTPMVDAGWASMREHSFKNVQSQVSFADFHARSGPYNPFSPSGGALT